MKQNQFLGALAVLCLNLTTLPAQETNQITQILQLQQQLRQLQENFEKTQKQHQEQLNALQKQLDGLQQRQAVASQTAVTSSVPVTAITPITPPEAAPAPNVNAPWNPAAPMRLIGGNQSYLNLSLDGLMAAGGSTARDLDRLQPGGHDPNQRGFTLQNLELVLDGAVDPYFRAQANLISQINSAGESNYEVEEAYAETTSLPGNFQIKAGQYVTEFGRLNPSHPHAWNFVDQPLVNNRMFGGDGLRNPGARISWLAPTPFYSELLLNIQNSRGGTAFSYRNPHGADLLFGRPEVDRPTKTFSDLLFAPRYAASFDLSPSQTAMVGASAAFGPNSAGEETTTQIYGLDLFWKWKPVNHHGGFPFVSWQTEAMLRRYRADAYADVAASLFLPRETLVDYGYYSQLAWGFKKGWVAGLRGDWVGGHSAAFYPDPDRDARWRISPNLTWHPTEFSKIRLQYNYDRRDNIGQDHSVWLQLEFLLGAHAAHKF